MAVARPPKQLVHPAQIVNLVVLEEGGQAGGRVGDDGLGSVRDEDVVEEGEEEGAGVWV